MPRAPLRLVPGLVAALACASGPPLPAGVSAAPVAGDSFDLLLAKLRHAEDDADRVELRELLISAVDAEPWRPLAPAAAAVHPGRVAVIAGRRCHWRDGVHFGKVDRGSWYLLDAGALYAFDHPGFGARCATQAAYAFARADQVEIEHTLERYLTQRYPADEIDGELRLQRGLALLALGRRDDAQYELFALDRRIRELERRASPEETPDPDLRARLRGEAEQLGPLRARLAHALQGDRTKEDEQP